MTVMLPRNLPLPMALIWEGLEGYPSHEFYLGLSPYGLLGTLYRYREIAERSQELQEAMAARGFRCLYCLIPLLRNVSCLPFVLFWSTSIRLCCN